MIDTQAIRNRIIDQAIRGKLTKQLLEDGTAEELYQQIQQKKQDLEKAGKIKKSKPLMPVSDDEIQFEIPENWKWVRFNDIYNFIDYRGATPEKLNDGVPFVTAKNVRQGYLDYTVRDYISEYDYANRQSRGISHKGDILFTTEAPMGYAAIADLEKYSAGQRLITLQQYGTEKYLENKFYVYCVSASFFQKQLSEKSSGTTVKGIKADRLKQLIIPLVPFAEQKRIVAIIDAVFPILEAIDSYQNRYYDNLVALKSKLINAAIQGKLTEQLPEDGTAEELYQQIQQEKQDLEKTGKIKKSKALLAISDDEKPFKIPDNWKWVKWGDLSKQIQYGYISSAKSSGNVKMVRISDIHGNIVNWENVPYCDISKEELEIYQLHNNDILFARTGGTVGKSYLVENMREVAVFAGYLIRTTYSQRLNAQYIKYFMDSRLYWKQLQDGTTATAQPNCNGQTLSKMIIPLPPLAEQKRIVAKLNELLPLCE